jgi:hypothetical protein
VAGGRAGRALRKEATSVVDEKKPRRFGAIGINCIRASYFSLFLSTIEVDLGGGIKIGRYLAELLENVFSIKSLNFNLKEVL